VKPLEEILSYKAAVLECQKILDDLSIPTAKGVTCLDPECKSGLGHRLRELRDKYNSLKKLIEAIEKSLKESNTHEEFEDYVRQLFNGKKLH